MYATVLIAVPTGVKVFNWVTTMWKDSLTFETPMLFAIAFVILFTIGGFSGVVALAIVPADFQYRAHAFVIACTSCRARHRRGLLDHGGDMQLLAAEVVRQPVFGEVGARSISGQASFR